MDLLVPGQRAEFLDPRLHVVPGDPLSRRDALQINIINHIFVRFDDAQGNSHAQIALRAEHRDPQPALHPDLLRRRRVSGGGRIG